MNKKVIGILICIIFLTTAASPVISSKTFDNITANNKIIDEEKTFYSVDVPVWEKGTVWTYDVNDINIDIKEYGTIFHLHIGTSNIPFEVVDDSGSTYQVSFKTRISGNVYVEADVAGLSIKIQANLIRTKLSGEISYRKSDLAINSISMQLSGKVAFSISKPIRLPALRMFVNLKLNIGFSNPYTHLFFPMEKDISWGLPATGVSIDGSIKSPWLRVVNIAHDISRFMGLIPSEYKDLSDKIVKILPVIDIGDTLTLFEISNPYDISEVPNIFYCSDMENISVQAGSYDAYNISILGWWGTMYYAPNVGRIIKITGNFKDVIPYLGNINMELVKVGTSNDLDNN